MKRRRWDSKTKTKIVIEGLSVSSPQGNVQGHMAVSPRMGKWGYIWHKQLKKRG